MIDWAEQIKFEQRLQDVQAAAAKTGHTVKVHFKRSPHGYMLDIDANHPVLFVFDGDMDDISYHLHGDAVHSLVGSCPCNMTPIEELAKEGITELVLAGDDGRDLVIPIGPFTGPEA